MLWEGLSFIISVSGAVMIEDEGLSYQEFKEEFLKKFSEDRGRGE